jgi:hypothetical protein
MVVDTKQVNNTSEQRVKIMKASNQKSSILTSQRKPFTANNLFSEIHGENYFVFSYGHHWILYAFVNCVWYENKDRYSVSTSKHRSQSRPTSNTILVSNEEIRKFY